MKINELKLLNFRNYERLNLNFHPSMNIIIGKNGMGKTNIIEAIYVLGFTKSFRGTRDDIVIRKNCDLARVDGVIEDKYKNSYQIVVKSSEKRVKINNTVYSKLSDYLSRINIVLFNSEDLKLIKDTPSTRRKLIDIELSQFNNDYLKLLNYYNKVLKQRNTYLKTLYLNGNASKEYLTILTEQLVTLGMKICNYRNEFINNISNYIEKNYLSIAGEEGLTLIYKSDFINKEKDELMNMYKKETNHDIITGKTNIGIHRDDFDFSLNGFYLKDFGSEGEQKNAIISLKMAEMSVFKDQKNIYPILILDDLFSELDKTKIENIIKFINDDIQTFITTTEIDKIDPKLVENSKIFEIYDGEVKERG